MKMAGNLKALFCVAYNSIFTIHVHGLQFEGQEDFNLIIFLLKIPTSAFRIPNF